MTIQKNRDHTALHSVSDQLPKNVFQRLQFESKLLPGFLSKWKRWEIAIHLVVWVSFSVIFNIPNLDFTIGIFRGADYSLLVPSLYGVPINMAVFYINTLLVAKYLKKDGAKLAPLSFLLLGISCLEGPIDLAYYALFYQDINRTIVWEGLYGAFLMNSMFFFLPSYVYGTLKASLFEEDFQKKIEIKDGSSDILLSPEEILFLESEGNYVAFHTTKGKYLERVSLSKASERLPRHFIQCHKSFIVNSLSISKKSATELKIAHHKIPIGRKYKANLA